MSLFLLLARCSTAEVEQNSPTALSHSFSGKEALVWPSGGSTCPAC